MPFSWRIKNYLEELWVHALHNEGNGLSSCYYLNVVVRFCFYIYFFVLLGHNQQEFDEFFWKTPLGRYIMKADPELQTEFFHRYLQDFVCMTMNVTCPEDLQVVFLFILMMTTMMLCTCIY